MRDPLRSAVRLMRSAPLTSLEEIAATVSADQQTLQRWAGSGHTRGGCAQQMAAASGPGMEGAAALWPFPPALRRSMGLHGPGVSGWAARGTDTSTAATGADLMPLLLDAQNPSTPAPSLRRLATYGHVLVRGEAAQHRCLPAATLAAVSRSDPRPAIRSYAVENPNCPAAAVNAAAEDSHRNVRAAAAAVTGTPRWLERLASDGHPDARASTARHPACPPELLERLAGDHNHEVRAAVASNPNCPPDILEHRTRDTYTPQAAAAANPGCPSGLHEGLGGHSHPPVRAAAASNPNCAPVMLERLAGDETAIVRAAAAANPGCPPDILERLAEDPDMGPRAAAASNHGCPPDILERLAGDPDMGPRAAAASNHGCPPGALDRCARSPDSGVRLSAAGNPGCPAATLLRLASDASLAVQAAARRSLAAAGLGTPPRSGRPRRQGRPGDATAKADRLLSVAHPDDTAAEAGPACSRDEPA